MLTFRFTGVSGEMTETEMLTAGMVGKEVQLEFSEDWEGLRKAVVFAAGGRACTVVDAQERETIPAEVLSESLRRLYVGAYGLTEDGELVIPTVYATGPFIHIGTSSSGGDSGYEPEDPFWLELEDAVAQTLRFTPQSLSEEQMLRSRQNIGAAKEDPEVAQLLVAILKNGVYVTDQQENILRLSVALCGGVVCSISCVLEHVTVDNKTAILAQGDGYRAVLTAEEGYVLDAVTVTMGGEDITAGTYADGVVSIPEVAGDVVITASAVEKASVAVERIAKGSVSFVANAGLQINATSAYRAMVLPVGQYLTNGKTYRFGIGTAAGVYAYGVQIMEACEPGLVFSYATDRNVYYNTVIARPVDTGWMQTDYEYTVTEENSIVTVNFKRMDGNVLTGEDYAVLLENFVMEEV